MFHITVSCTIVPYVFGLDSSYTDGFDGQPAHLPQSPAARAAGLARGALVFRQKLLSGQLSPDGTREDQFCMDTYRYVTEYRSSFHPFTTCEDGCLIAVVYLVSRVSIGVHLTQVSRQMN
jgi:hypothetical protein